MLKLFKEFILLILGIILFTIYEFLYNEGTIEFNLILKRSLILGGIGILLLLIIEIIKYFKRKKHKTNN